jgi:hypothetical protein
MDKHDTVYKLLFSHDRRVRDLLLGFLPPEWTIFPSKRWCARGLCGSRT